jgi:hypothetical protein
MRTDLVMLWVLRNHARNLYILKLQVPRDQADYELEHTRHNNTNNNSAMLNVLGLRASWINYWGLMVRTMKAHVLPLHQLHSYSRVDGMCAPPPPPRGISWSLKQDPGAR